MKVRYVATALVKIDDKFLFIKKKDDDTLYMPGGEIEKDENIIDALKREFLEECNINIGNIEPIDFIIVEAKHDGIMCQNMYLRFTAEYVSGELKPGDDAVEAVMLSQHELKDSKQYPHTFTFFEKLDLI